MRPAVFVVFKQSAYTRFRENCPRLSLGRSLSRVLRRSHESHHETLGRVCRLLTERGYRVFKSFRGDLRGVPGLDRRFRFVLTVGGDGTFLETARYLRKTPILGVNSDPKKSVARFSACGMDRLEGILRRFEDGELAPVLLSRLGMRLNGKAQPALVLNDLLVASSCPAEASRYRLTVRGRTEEQMSSGIWISTSAGSTAANASAGGRVLPSGGNRFQYIVREVYHRKTGRRKLLGGVLGPDEKMMVVSGMRNGKIYVDGANLQLPFGPGTRLEVARSRSPLKVIGLKV